MSYSYNQPAIGNPDVMYNNYPMQYKDPCKTLAIGASAVGGVTGLAISLVKNPYISKSGKIKKSFIDNIYSQTKNKFEEMLKALNKIKTVESYKKFIEKYNLSLIENLPKYCENITQENLKDSQKKLINYIKSAKDLTYSNIKNTIENCWDKATKTFVKNENIEDKLFETISKAKKGIKAKSILKHTAIGALGTGLVTYVATKILLIKNLQKQNMNANVNNQTY